MPAHMRSSITDHNTHRAATRRSTRWGAVLVGMVALVTAFAVAAPAGVVRPPETGPRPTTMAPILQPGYVGPTPNITKVANAIAVRSKSLTTLVTVPPGLPVTQPGEISIGYYSPAGMYPPGFQRITQLKPSPYSAPRPGSSIAQPDRGVAPTVNLSQVAYAIAVRSKSLTTLVTVPPGLPVTQAVEISIGYYSPAGMYPPGFQRITQSYVRGTGNRFLNNDPEGEGKPRRLRMDISLREPKPGGTFYTHAFSLEQDLDPLYDVTISPLNFSLIDNCDVAGNSEIRFEWWAPDAPDQKRRTFSFTTRVGRSTTISQIAWARAEVSARNNLRQLSFLFWEKDDVHPATGFRAPEQRSRNNLVPGKTKVVKGNLTDSDLSNKQDCRAYYEYTITYTLRLYPNP